MGKSKSKCETEGRQASGKKYGNGEKYGNEEINIDVRSTSKKTLRKRKPTKCAVDEEPSQKIRIANSKHDEESETIKSSGKKKWAKK